MEAPSVPTLYHTKWCPSSVPLNVAKELNIPSEEFCVKTITEEEMKHGEEFGKVSARRINPAVLLPNGSTLLETGAITMYMLESFDKTGKLHALIGDKRRPKFLQGMFYALTDAYHTSGELYRVTKVDKVRDEKKLAEIGKKIDDLLIKHLERELKNGEFDYYIGDQYTAVDMLFAYLLMTVEYCEMDFGSDIVKAYYTRLQTKEGFRFAYYSPEDCYKTQ